MEILVTGATGFVGRRLVAELIGAGHAVRAGTRRPRAYDGPGTPVHIDLDDPESLPPALKGCDLAYYLVHSLAEPDFAGRDRELATAFGRCAADHVEGVVYLGGLGRRGQGSAHLRSRHEVGDVLAEHVATVELRASLVLGPGGASYELLRQTVDRLLALPGPDLVVVPRAFAARTQPIGLADAAAYLVAAPGLDAGVYDIGAPDPVTYAELMAMQADAAGGHLRPRPILPVAPTAFAPVADLLTDQTGLTSHALLLSAGEDAVVEDDRIIDLTGHSPVPLPRVLERLAAAHHGP